MVSTVIKHGLNQLFNRPKISWWNMVMSTVSLNGRDRDGTYSAKRGGWFFSQEIVGTDGWIHINQPFSGLKPSLATRETKRTKRCQLPSSSQSTRQQLQHPDDELSQLSSAGWNDHALTNPGSNMLEKYRKYTLWWTNIAMENHHF